MTRPVFVTVMEYSSSVLNVGATIAPGISTERIPPIFSAGRHSPVDQLGLVGPWNKTVQSVLSGSDTNDGGTDSAGPVGPDVSVDQSQPVAEGQYVTRSPVGSDGMLSTCDSDQPVAVGYIYIYIYIFISYLIVHLLIRCRQWIECAKNTYKITVWIPVWHHITS